MSPKRLPAYKSVDMGPDMYLGSSHAPGYKLLALNTIGAATILYEYRSLGDFRIIEWGIYDGYGQDRGRVSTPATLEIGNALYYSTLTTLYGRAWGYSTRERAKTWGIIKDVQEAIPKRSGRSYD